MDSSIERCLSNIYADLTIDRDEAADLDDFLKNLNPPPDKLFKLRSTAFRMACKLLSEDKKNNISLLRTVNYVVHAIENNFMRPRPVSHTVPLDEGEVMDFFDSVYDELSVDAEESKSLSTFFKVTHTPAPQDLNKMRSLAFKSAVSRLSDDDATNIKLLRCINAVVHAFEISCYKPKPFNLRLEKTVDLNMNLEGAVQHLWDLDVNRLTPNDDYTINVGRGKKPYWKDDSADMPLFSSVDRAVWKRPTYAAFLALLDNYIAETGVAENVSNVERREISKFLDRIMETGPMQFCHKYCHAKAPNRVPADRAGFIRLLKEIWFALYRRARHGRNDSSGFEHVFIGEVKNGDVSGFHNWVQFYLEEQKKTLDYRGYIKPRGRSARQDANDHLLTMQFRWSGVEKFVGTSFIGCSPEFEMALYTTCFLVGEEENKVELDTGADIFGIVIKCYTMRGRHIGTTFPEVTSHFEDDDSD